jgi:hypothetical protein
MHMVVLPTFSNGLYISVGKHICRALPDLVDQFNFLTFGSRALIGNFPTTMWKPMTRPCGIQPLGHANQLYSHLPHQHTVATSASISAYHFILPRPLPRHCMVCHVAVWTATRHFSLVHGLTQKIQKRVTHENLSYWPRHHADINMTCVTSCMCHIHCMDADVICTDADVRRMLTHPLLIELG